MGAFARSFCSFGVLLCAAASAAIAQGATPRLTIGPGPGTSSWPGVGARVDDDAYVTVIAVTRGVSNFPAHVLYPLNPADSGKVSAGEQVRLRSLGDDELVHLVSMGEAPIIIGFASRTRPNRSGFVVRKRWGKDLFLETESSTPEELAKELAELLFGSSDAVYDVAIRGATRPVATSRAMAFSGNAPSCGFFGAGYSVYGRLGAGSVRYASYIYGNGDLPYSQFGGRFNSYPMGPIGFGYPFPMSSAMYYALSGETYALAYSEAGCDVYRVAWYPRYDPDLTYFYQGPGTRRPRSPGTGDSSSVPSDTGGSPPPRRHPRDLPRIDPTRATGVSGDRIRAIASADSNAGVGRRMHPRTTLGDLLEAKERTALEGNRRTAEWEAGSRRRANQGSDETRDVRRYNRDDLVPAGGSREARNAAYRREVAEGGQASNGQTRERQTTRPVNDGDEIRRAPRAEPPRAEPARDEPRVAMPVPTPAPAPMPVESRRVERTIDPPSPKSPTGSPGTP